MAGRIPEILNSRKMQDAMLLFAVLLLGFVSFGLGRLSAQEDTSTPVTLYKINETSLTAQVSQKTSVDQTAPSTVAQTGRFVASRSGEAYHFPWCSGAKRIKEENKVWFTTREAAVAAGYRPASNCKGL